MVDLREELSEEEEEDEEDEEDVIKISCGGRHSLALAAGGRLYGWGSNTRGQLGLPRAVYDSDSTFGVTRQQIPRLLLPAGPHPPSLHVPVCRSCASDGDVTSFLVLSGSSVLEGDEGGDDLGAAHQDDDIDKFQMSVQTSVGTIGDACGLGGGCVWQAARAGTGAAEVGGLVQSVRRSQQQATAVAEGGSVISGLGGNVICYCGGGDVDAGHHHSGGGVIGGAVSMYEHGVRRGLWGGALSGELVVEDVEGGWSHTVVCCKIRKGENK
ncbi:hypothetical protein Vretimale_7420 [Volvox reticuliferus]|nr:hypothetical protein Vretifemale_7568 [Volvox reticuliferus]GIM02668.1 hypothetical protein Vretimale_7420 [Volvox reticuliferus]